MRVGDLIKPLSNYGWSAIGIVIEIAENPVIPVIFVRWVSGVYVKVGDSGWYHREFFEVISESR